jgi:hypothetical protein
VYNGDNDVQDDKKGLEDLLNDEQVRMSKTDKLVGWIGNRRNVAFAAIQFQTLIPRIVILCLVLLPSLLSSLTPIARGLCPRTASLFLSGVYIRDFCRNIGANSVRFIVA